MYDKSDAKTKRGVVWGITLSSFILFYEYYDHARSYSILVYSISFHSILPVDFSILVFRV